MYNDDKTYVSVYVSKETAKEIKKLESCENEKAMVQKVATDMSLHIEQELSQLDDDLARYKAAAIVFKNSLKEVYQEQQGQIETLIEEVWDVMPKVKQESSRMVNELQEELAPMAEQVKELNKEVTTLKNSIGSVNIWGAEQIVNLAKTINSLDSDSKDILKFLTDNYKKGE